MSTPLFAPLDSKKGKGTCPFLFPVFGSMPVGHEALGHVGQHGIIAELVDVDAVTAAAIAANLAVYYNTWQSLEIPSSPKCFLEMRARVALCPEFDRRIAFESGKRVGIWIDTCGLDKFGVYKLANGAIYLESEVGFGNSYIIDSKNEKVYEALGGSAIELKGGMLCGRDGGGGESEVSYETYGGENGNFKSPSIPAAKLLDGKKFIGRLSRRAFRPCAEPERQPPAPQQTQ